MDDAIRDWLRASVERPEVRATDPARVAALRDALESPDPPVARRRHGSLVCRAPGPPGRRLLTFDRRGALLEALRWDEAGDRLAWAACLTPEGRWVGIEPGGGSHPWWGASDVVWLLEGAPPWRPLERVTEFQALDWARLDFIPPAAEPARLPPGGGAAIHNLLAGLMADQGAGRVRYRGPYPTETLFAALLESFRYDADAASPLDRFVSGEPLDWLPAPHERHHVAGGVVVQLREEVDKVVLGGAPYYRRDWQGVIRREPRVVRRDGPRIVCSLWALGQAIEDRLVLDETGEVVEPRSPAQDPRPPAPFAPVWRSALADLIGRQSIPPLAGAIIATLGGLSLEWGAVPGDLLAIEGETVRVSHRLRDAACAWIAAATADARIERAIACADEVACLLGDAVRRRAQARLAALTEEEQWRVLRDAPPTPGPLGESVGRLLALLVAGGA